MPLTPAMTELLAEVAAAAAAADSGGKGAVYEAACARLGMSLATLHRKLAAVAVRAPRKRRADAGKVALPLEQAQELCAKLMEGYRANNKKIVSLKLTLTRLRAHNPRFAEVLDVETGETRMLSDSACARALFHYGLHPTQLRRPTPTQPQRSLHPNDVWQIDASISTLFYVPGSGEGQGRGGVADMAPSEFYKNKPENFERIKRQRLTRYVITDHTSGAIFVHYVPGGESTTNMAEAFLRCIQPRPQQMMHGVPRHLSMDPGSAGVSGAFGNLLRRLQVEPVVNEAGNPRAKGQAENAHNIVECDFESGFKYTAVPSIDWINDQAATWMRYYNSTQIHGRHGLARYAKWMEITATELRLVDAALARELLTHTPATPKVNLDLHVRFAGKLWDVREVPGIMPGEQLKITYNLYRPGTAYVVETGADGHELLIDVPEVAKDKHGFVEGAALIAREFKAPPDTLLDTNRKLIERLATETTTDAAAAQARKAKALPFAGKFDPYAHHANVPDVHLLARRGTDLVPTVTTTRTAAPARVLSLFEVAAELARRGVAMSADRNAQVRTWHPDGVPEDQLDALQARLTVRAGLRVVAGGAAND